MKPGAPHVLVIRTPDERLVWLSGLHSRRHAEVTVFLRGYTGFLIVDGFRGYQTLLTCDKRVLAGIQQCCQHVFRRAKQVGKLGPGGLQSWAGKVSEVLKEAHTAVEAAKARGERALDPGLFFQAQARRFSMRLDRLLRGAHLPAFPPGMDQAKVTVTLQIRYTLER